MLTGGGGRTNEVLIDTPTWGKFENILSESNQS